MVTVAEWHDGFIAEECIWPLTSDTFHYERNHPQIHRSATAGRPAALNLGGVPDIQYIDCESVR